MNFSIIKYFCDMYNEFYTCIKKRNVKIDFWVNEKFSYDHIDHTSIAIFLHIIHVYSLLELLIINCWIFFIT